MVKFLITTLLALTTGLASGQVLDLGESIDLENGIRLQLLDVNEGNLIKYTKINIDGSKVQEGTYLDGVPHGVWTMYHLDGTTSKMEYKHGKRVVMSTFDNSGRRVDIVYRDNKPIKMVSYIE